MKKRKTPNRWNGGNNRAIRFEKYICPSEVYCRYIADSHS